MREDRIGANQVLFWECKKFKIGGKEWRGAKFSVDQRDYN